MQVATRPSPRSSALRLRPCVAAAFDRRLDRASAAPIAVAFSGGGDSLALLLAAKSWASNAGRGLLALHVDHRLQGQSSAWAAFAERTCADLDVPVRILRWIGPKPASGLPAAARSARLRLLAEAARDASASVLLLGHTADDGLEADLMRAEGSTLGRLAEWSPSPVWPEGRGIFHFRPLLGMRRARLREALAGRSWIEDPANDNPAYARARARALLSSPVAQRTGEGDRTKGGGGGKPQAPADQWGKTLFETPETEPGARAHHHASPGPPPPYGFAYGRGEGALTLSAHALTAGDLSAALVCAAGHDRPPRGSELARLLDRMRAGQPFTATLAGARIEVQDGLVMICRDAGEYLRSKPPSAVLAPGVEIVWDGRFSLRAAEPGWTVRPLKGLAARLFKAERRALTALPAAVRPALPVLVNAAVAVICPILAETSPVTARCLVSARFAAATGLAATESQAVALARGGSGPAVLSWA